MYPYVPNRLRYVSMVQAVDAILSAGGVPVHAGSLEGERLTEILTRERLSLSLVCYELK
jgi:hypothetical protein